MEKSEWEAEYKKKIESGMTPEEIRLEDLGKEVDEYNAKQGKLQYYNCKKCNNKGDIAILQNGEITYKSCSCIRIRYARKLIEDNGLSEAVKTLTFDKFKAEEEWQATMKKTAVKYALSDLRKWFFIGGQSGIGKTHLCTAIVGKLMNRGVPVNYMPYAEVIQKLIADFYSKEAYCAEICDYKYCEVLYIDDFLKNVGKTSTNEMRIVFELVDYRYKNKLPTIISSEFTAEKMMSLDSALFGRIKERAKEYIVNIGYDEHKNYRINTQGDKEI